MANGGSSAPDSAPRLSFVIPAYNEAELIAETIGSLRAAGSAVGEPYEIVVADDASDDTTREVAADLGARVVSEQHRQISATRNVGAKAARGEWLIFVDADTLVPAETVRAAVEAMRDRGIVGGGCRCEFDDPKPLWARVIGPPIIWLYAKSRLTPGAFVFCTREAFEAVGGFDESVFGGEEVYFARAVDQFARARGSRFTILPQRIVTSSRKLRTHSPFEVFGTLIKAARTRARTREGMDLWYGPRRADPGRRQAAPED
ncbi:MAG: glycosyltransferase [Phycisphaerales bacterium]|nr:glycosyltransferase [Phycisphaerales bacterium]